MQRPAINECGGGVNKVAAVVHWLALLLSRIGNGLEIGLGGFQGFRVMKLARTGS